MLNHDLLNFATEYLGLLIAAGSIVLAGLALAALFWVPKIRLRLSGKLHRLD